MDVRRGLADCQVTEPPLLQKVLSEGVAESQSLPVGRSLTTLTTTATACNRGIQESMTSLGVLGSSSACTSDIAIYRNLDQLDK